MAHQNPSDEELLRVLSEAQNIAVVGASADPDRPSHGIFGRLLAAGYRVIPVNPQESSVLGQPAVASLAAAALALAPGRVDIVNVFRRPEHTPAIAEEAVAIGARVLWLQSGIRNEEAAARAQAGGLLVVMDDCIGVAHSRLSVPRRAAPGAPRA
jgi:predicted CoA-binding protein